jgi:parallel beta-helix repeat protein
MKLRRFAILSSVFVCFSNAAPAFADTLVVDNDFADCPRADFNSIQVAVVAAQPGDKIVVCRGVYLETVLVNKPDLRIEAQAAPGEVVLQGTPAQQFGFHLLNTTGVLVQGFTVQGFGTALDTTNPLNQGANIRIEGGSGNRLRKNVTRESVGGDGIEVLNSSANVVEHNSSYANRGPLSDGITVFGALASNNIIRHNETFENGQTGINILGPTGTGNVVFGNRSHGNLIGIRNVALQGRPDFGAHGNVIENNRVFANGQGIVVGLSTHVIVRHNRSERNNEFGIRLQNGATNNLVEKNEVFHNTQDGIRLEGGPIVVAKNIVQLNLVRRNGRDGIRVSPSSAENAIERNVIRESGEHDAHDDSVGPGTGGTGNLWINNKCEEENRPGLCEHPDH